MSTCFILFVVVKREELGLWISLNVSLGSIPAQRTASTRLQRHPKFKGCNAHKKSRGNARLRGRTTAVGVQHLFETQLKKS